MDRKNISGSSRRDFLGACGAGMLAAADLVPSMAGGLAVGAASWLVTDRVRAESAAGGARKRMAVVTTEWRYRSHAWHMAERFLVGYPRDGHWHRPPFDVVSAYVDQKPDGDLSAGRSKEFGFPIYGSIAEALRCGGEKLAVDAVLIIGEHGKYPQNDFQQTQYPRYEFFKQVTDVFRKDGRALPVFNDKHLSWKWEWAKEMYDISRELNFGFCAGSSLPVTWRMPAIDMPYDAEVEEMLCVAIGGIDSYDFHALEVIQCMAERRRGGETGVKSLQALRGDAVWRALEAGVQELPDMYRAVFLSRDVEGMATVDAAEILGVTEDVVKTRLHRARLMLRKHLDGFLKTHQGSVLRGAVIKGGASQ